MCCLCQTWWLTGENYRWPWSLGRRLLNARLRLGRPGAHSFLHYGVMLQFHVDKEYIFTYIWLLWDIYKRKFASSVLHMFRLSRFLGDTSISGSSFVQCRAPVFSHALCIQKPQWAQMFISMILCTNSGRSMDSVYQDGHDSQPFSRLYSSVRQH